MTKMTLPKQLKKRLMISGALLPLLFFAVSPSPTFAEGVYLRVNPSVLQIRTQSQSDVRAPLIIENQSEQSIKLKVGYKLFDPAKSQNGKVVYLEDPGTTASIFDHIQVLDNTNTPINSLDLGPKQQKQLEVRVVLPPNTPSADYYFSLIFLHDITAQTDQNSTIRDRKDQHTITTVQGGIGTNILLAVGAPETAQGYIEEFSSPLYLQSGPVPFSLKIKNTGLHYINPKGTIMIKNIFGQTVGKVEIPSTTVLAGTTRSMIDKEQVEAAVMQEVHPKAIWPERFLLGLYTADLQILMAAEGPSYSQTIRFFAFPLHIALILILTIGISIGIYVRVKKKLS